MKTYAELLKDPRWWRKRLEILERDNYTCQYCGEANKSKLHIHHLAYRGEFPWEAEEYELITLCRECHQIEHMPLTPLERFLIGCMRNRDAEMQPNWRKSFNRIIKRLKNG